MDQDRDFTARIIVANLKLHTKYKDDPMPGPIGYMGLMNETLTRSSQMSISPEHCYDMCFLSHDFGPEKYLMHLKFLWNCLRLEGLLVADYINSHDVFHEFCRVSNREPVIFDTRYGIGIIEK